MLFYDYSNLKHNLESIGWIDTTWGNNACPSFEFYLDSIDVWLILWADYPKPEDRESFPAQRFSVNVYSSYDTIDGPEPDELMIPDSAFQCETEVGLGMWLGRGPNGWESDALSAIHTRATIEKREAEERA